MSVLYTVYVVDSGLNRHRLEQFGDSWKHAARVAVDWLEEEHDHLVYPVTVVAASPRGKRYDDLEPVGFKIGFIDSAGAPVDQWHAVIE